MYELKAICTELVKNPNAIYFPNSRKLRVSRDKIEIKFNYKLTIDEIKKEIKKHYKVNNGKIEFLGEILYYEWYENKNLFYKFDIDGNIIESTKFASPKFQNDYKKIFEVIKKIVDEVDPMNIAWVDENEYEPEIRDLTTKLVGENLNKEEVFQITKKVFDFWFWEKEENIPKYKEIAEKIFNFMQRDELYEEAKQIVLNNRNSSISFLQRTLQISYKRAAKIIKQLEQEKILDKPNKNEIRKILIPYKLKKRTFTKEDKIKEAFLRIANVLYSYWKISNPKEKEKLQCGGDLKLFEILISEHYIIKGESVKGKECKEYIVPLNLIKKQAYLMFNSGYLIEDVVNMIKNNLIIIYITNKEKNKIIALGYKDKMPENWHFGHNPYERLEIAEIEIKFYNQT